jgi:predicted component of type VI protein secretion system
MTAKLILSLDGAPIQEYPLSKERTTIGRKADNDIIINNLAVSSHHAAIITIGHDSFMEDLDSTNGLAVNGVTVKKHFLQNNDVIEIGKYKLKYLNDHVTQTNAADFEKTVIMRAPAASFKAYTEKSGDTGLFQSVQSVEFAKTGAEPARVEAPLAPVAEVVAPPAAPAAPTLALAAIQILNGPNAGKELDLVKGLTTLGKPGVQVAVLTRRPHGYFITHVEGASFPSVNGQVLSGQPCQLKDHDLIELAGIKMEFYFKN